MTEDQVTLDGLGTVINALGTQMEREYRPFNESTGMRFIGYSHIRDTV